MPKARGPGRRPPNGWRCRLLGDSIGMLIEIGATIVLIVIATAIAILATRGRLW